MNYFRATLRELALGEITRLESLLGANSQDPLLQQARLTLWALEFADGPTTENLKRLQTMVAVKAIKTVTGVTTRQALPPTSERLRAVGVDTWAKVFLEDQIAETNPITQSWDGSKFTLATPRGAWVQAQVVIESTTANAESFTAAFQQLSGAENIQNLSSAYEDKALRPVRLFMPVYVPINGLSHFAADNYFDPHKAPRFQSTANPPNAATREALGKHCVNILADMTIPSVGQTHSVEPGESFSMYWRVWVPEDHPAGEMTGAITITDGAGGVLEVPITIDVSTVVLNKKNFIPMISYVASGPAGERLSGKLFPSNETEIGQENTMIDAVARELRANRITSVFDEFSGSAVPSEDVHAPRLLGPLYSGSKYLGPAEGEPVDLLAFGMYHQWANLPGVGGTVAVREAATIPAALQTQITDYLAWRADNLPTTEVLGYLFDEANDEELLAQIEKWAGWFSDFTTIATTGSTLVPPFGLNYEHMIADAPSVDHIAIAAPIMPTDSVAELQAHKARAADKKVSIYNGISPMDVSYMLDEVGNAGLLRWLVKLKHHLQDDLIDMHFYWGACEWRNNEGAGVFSGAPEGTYIDPGDNRGRPNLRKTGNSFGQSDINVDRNFDGHSGFIYSEGDGHLVAPGVDFFFPEDSFGVEDALPTVRLFNECAGIQSAQVLYQKYQTDPSVLTDITTAIPVSLWELGVTEDGLATEKRAYLNKANPLHSVDNEALIGIVNACLSD